MSFSHPSLTTLVRAVVRGATFGLLLGAIVMVIVGLIEARLPSSARWERVLAFGSFAALVGLLAAAPTAALEAWARRLALRTRSSFVACGGLVAGTGVLVFYQVVYLVGAVRHGDPEWGLRSVDLALTGAPLDLLGALFGVFLAVALPFATSIGLRLRGRRLLGQTVLGAGVVALGAGAVILAAFVTTGGAFDPRVVHPLLVFPVAAATLCGFALLAIGLPLTLLTPLALALSDRLGDGLAAAVELRWEGACRGSA